MPLNILNEGNDQKKGKKPNRLYFEFVPKALLKLARVMILGKEKTILKRKQWPKKILIKIKRKEKNPVLHL